jgi:adenine-specific DNA-methyltransferase
MATEQKVTGNIKVPNTDREILKKHFSHCFDKDGNFLIEKFQKSLDDSEINFSKESYGMDWLGKSYARLLASDAATTLLTEDTEHNQKPENKNSENLLLRGDNLEVLKHLVGAYYEKVKMIYIDPPYNTGGDGFVYQDDRKFAKRELQQLAGVSEERAKRILDFTQSKSNSHSAWLTFMYPRLYIAKQLLKEDGVIFVSIDDNEVAQLRLLMDEIFGEENFVENFSWVNNQRGRSTDKHISNTFENILMYSKSIDNCIIFDELEVDEKKLGLFNQKDDISYYKRGDNLFNNNSQFNIETRPNLVYSIYVNKKNNDWICVDEKYLDENNQLVLPKENLKSDEYIKVIPPIRQTNNKMGCWRWSIEKFEKESKTELLLEEKSDGTYMFYTKNRLDDKGQKWNKHKNVIKGITSVSGTNELVAIFKDKIFPSPKPSRLLMKLVQIGSSPSDLIMDFFAGSGTTGDAVMQLNAEDGGNRKYILVQLPEPIDKKKNKTAYDFVKKELQVGGTHNDTRLPRPSSPRSDRANEPTIFEITKERLIRAAKKIKEETIAKSIADKQKEIKELEGKLDLNDKEAKIEQLKKSVESLGDQDLGFKIFGTNEIWEDYNFEADEMSSDIVLFDESKLTADDIKALLITWKTYDGIPLTQELEAVDLAGYKAHYGKGKLYLMDKGFTTDSLVSLLEKIDSEREFSPSSVIAFGYHFDSKNLRELAENLKTYANKKSIDIDFITRY